MSQMCQPTPEFLTLYQYRNANPYRIGDYDNEMTFPLDNASEVYSKLVGSLTSPSNRPLGSYYKVVRTDSPTLRMYDPSVSAQGFLNKLLEGILNEGQLEWEVRLLFKATDGGEPLKSTYHLTSAATSALLGKVFTPPFDFQEFNMRALTQEELSHTSLRHNKPQHYSQASREMKPPTSPRHFGPDGQRYDTISPQSPPNSLVASSSSIYWPGGLSTEAMMMGPVSPPPGQVRRVDSVAAFHGTLPQSPYMQSSTPPIPGISSFGPATQSNHVPMNDPQMRASQPGRTYPHSASGTRTPIPSGQYGDLSVPGSSVDNQQYPPDPRMNDPQLQPTHPHPYQTSRSTTPKSPIAPGSYGDPNIHRDPRLSPRDQSLHSQRPSSPGGSPSFGYPYPIPVRTHQNSHGPGPDAPASSSHSFRHHGMNP